jgi:hypothetical protein
MIKRAEFMKEAHLDKTWNRINSFKGINIGTVLWQDKPWKLVSTTNFDEIKEGIGIIAEFYKQEELWQYIKNNNIISD